ncbi:GntR family transcriptional regulator, partial [Pseudoalteromonas sp. S409]|uniref:UTRA domain-containing protein n=1 Tax=Pseudoalteromonas sp. S409 TaxID=2066518 RepID=UPI0011093EEE
FPLQADGIGTDLPKEEMVSVELCPAPLDGIEALQLNKKDKVATLVRRRIIDYEFCMIATRFLPQSYFANLDQSSEFAHI